ncbi:MAG TPA: UDP-N-acetylmuramate dehydrogenase [Baekduia sp.]|nr:UDP-N-acetylmuramate dehydrogenase [Baekduia sp.]
MLLSDYTTLRLGGPAERFIEADTDDALMAAVRDADARGEPLLLLAGGSNVVVGDAGFPGTVVRIATRGIARDGATLHVAAGESWDALVAQTVRDGLAGIECLSGIPGSVGATPIQNVGAYGQEVSDTIISVRALDRRTGAVVDLAPEDCGFAYRSSGFKRDPEHHVVLRVSFALQHSDGARPIRYAELARAVGHDPSLAQVREAVLALRAGKGMVLDPRDPDTASAGSFFTNPILDADQLPDGAPGFPQPDGRVKTSAAWLIQNAGFSRGYGNPDGIALSSKHVLALTNRGRGTTTELLALATEIRDRVEERFGVRLVPEPVFVCARA